MTQFRWQDSVPPQAPRFDIGSYGPHAPTSTKREVLEMSGNKPTDLSRRVFMVTTALTALSFGVLWTQDGSAAGELNVRVTGAQDPTLIFVHGFAPPNAT